MWKLYSRLLARCLHQKYPHICKSTISNDSLQVISVPQKMIQKLEKNKNRKHFRDERLQRLGKKSKTVVIACKRKEFNCHKGEQFEDKGDKNLASHGWKHRKSVGDYFTVNSYSKNPALFDEYETGNFSEFNLNERLTEGLTQLGFHTMTKVQAAAIPRLLKGQQVIMAAETGSGKTLAYLVPLLERIHKQIQLMGTENKYNSPKAIILTPSRELTYQIGTVIESLLPYTDITYHVECGGRGTKSKLAWPQSRNMDILVSTPGILSKLLAAGHVKSSNLQHIVLDEADSLLDDSFSHYITNIINKLQVSSGEVIEDDGVVIQSGLQFILVGATLPRGLQEIIGHILPVDHMTKVLTSGLHRLMPHVPQMFIRVRSTDKTEETIRLLKTKRKPTLVFCNNSQTAFWLSQTLKENNINNILLSGELAEKKRHGRFTDFQEGKEDVLVATDIASRGLDTTRVDHIINFDFPLFMSDYIHRVGRVGRIGAHTTGYVTSLVVHKWDVDLLWKIETAARKQSELYNVNANIKRKIDGIISQKFG